MIAKAMGGQPVSTEEALAAQDALAADARCQWLEADAAHDAFLRLLVICRQPSPNLWSDARQAALAASKGFEVTSFDADFRSFPLPQFEHLKPWRPVCSESCGRAGSELKDDMKKPGGAWEHHRAFSCCPLIR
jgi:hypothetical protein